MGWTTCYTAKHWKNVKGRMVVDRKKCLDDLHTCQEIDKDGKILSYTRVLKSTMHGSVWYGACETVSNGKVKVWASVALTQGKSGYDGTIWGFKLMAEDEGPFYYDCPSTILRLLSPTKDLTTNLWRRECDMKRARRKIQRMIKLPAGVTVRYRGGWLISSPEYQAANHYSCVRYACKDKMLAVTEFITQYGTEAQKAEWAKYAISA